MNIDPYVQDLLNEFERKIIYGGRIMNPRGYLQVSRPISMAEAERLRNLWQKLLSTGQVPVLSDGVRFVPFETQSPLDPAIKTCGHCGQWGAVQTECRHCGASIF